MAHACSHLVLNPSEWFVSSVGGAEKCYGILSTALPNAFSSEATRSNGDCSHDCGYEGCQHMSTSYCSTNAQVVRIRTQLESVEIANRLSGSLPAGEVMWQALRTYDHGATWQFRPGGGSDELANWAADQPRDGSCSVINSDGTWASRDCSHLAACICEIQLGDFPSPPPAPPPPPPTSTTGVIVVGASGGAVGALALCAALRFLVRRRRRRHATAAPGSEGAASQVSRSEHVSMEDTRVAAAAA